MTSIGYDINEITINDLPEIKLNSTLGTIEVPKDFIGQITILCFYPADGSPVCSNQLAVYNQALPLFNKKGAEIYGISVDDMESHQKFAEKMNLRFPLIPDNDPLGEISKAFGVFNEQQNITKRAILVFNKKGQLHWKQVYPNHVNPGAEGIMKALDELTN